MFQTPIGGISILVNLFIVIVGSTIDFLIHKSSLVKHACSFIQELFAGPRFDHIIRRLVAYVIPVLMFLLVLGVTMISVFILRDDAKKVTIVDMAQPVFGEIKKAESRLLSSSYNGASAPVVNTVVPIGTATQAIVSTYNASSTNNASTSAATTTEAKSLVTLIEIFKGMGTSTHYNHPVAIDRLLGSSMTNANSFVLIRARDAALIDFMKANGIDTSKETRAKFAEYFGIDNYTSTKEQNELLKEKLLDIRFHDLANQGYASRTSVYSD